MPHARRFQQNRFLLILACAVSSHCSSSADGGDGEARINAPAAPVSLQAGSANTDSVVLRWEDQSNDETNFEIQRRTEDDEFTTVAVIDADETRYIDVGLAEETTYQYRVYASIEGVRSDPSNLAFVITAPSTHAYAYAYDLEDGSINALVQLERDSSVSIGTFDAGRFMTDVWAFRVDGAGQIEWQDSYGSTFNSWANDAIVNQAGEVIILGGTDTLLDHDALIVRLDGEGNLLESRTIGSAGADSANAIAEASNGDLVMVGWRESAESSQSLDGWVVRLDARANVLWERSFTRSGADSFDDVAITSARRSPTS